MGNARQTLQFYSGVLDAYIYPVDYVPHTGRRFTVSYEMKTNVTWIYSASHFASVEDALIFAFIRANGKPERPIGAKKDIFCLDTANRVYFLRGMNKGESKVKVGVNYGKSFLKMSSKIMVDYYNGFKLHQSSPSGSALKCSGAKRRPLQARGAHLNRQENVYLEKIKVI